MIIKQIYYTSIFEKHFKRLPSNIKRLAFMKEKLFRNDPLNSQLKTHALTGKLRGFHSFSINYYYRIMFKFEKENVVTLIDVGTHSIYK